LAFSLSGYVWIVDNGLNRVTKWSDGGPSPISEFGSLGSGNGQLKKAWGLARDSSGNVWVADAGNNRIEEFNSSGSFVRTAGTSGSGLLSKPEAVAVDSSNNVWVTDTGNNRVVEFKSNGEYVKAFGSLGSGNGQFKTPWGIAIDGAGHVWVSDSSNVRIEEFTSEGAWMRNVGKQGTEEGYLSWPGQLTIDSSNNVWVTDPGNNRITEYSNEGVYIRQFGTAGTGNGQFTHPGPWGIGIDGAGHVWASDTNNNRVEVFSSTGAFIGQFGQHGSAPGQFSEPGMLAITAAGEVFVADMENNRISKWSGGSYWEGTGASSGPETALPASATSTIEYGVPVSGTGAPYAMGSTDVAKWAQSDVPTQATAIFPPDEPQGWPASDYKRATVDYMDAQARTTNIAGPGGAISTSEFNEFNAPIRTLSAANRAKALEEGANSAEIAKLLDTESVYVEEGGRLTETLGPQHTVKIAKGNEKVPSGSEVSAREHTKYYYDEGAPANGETYNLVTKTTDGAETVAKEEFDVRTTTTSYSGQSNLGWKLRKPTSSTTDPAGLKITHTTVYDETTGSVLETRGPASAGAGDPHDQVTVYYTAGANSSYPACGGHIEWSGLPCETLPGKQPETSGLPPLPVTTMTYNIWDQPEKITETFGSTTRTKKTSFDAAGRPTSSEVTSTIDTALPTVKYKYDESLGSLRTENETFEGKEKTITTLHNTLGQLYSYTDADGGEATYTFDIDGRVTEAKEHIQVGANGSQTYTRDPTTGQLTTLVDSGAGTFTATYDVAGNMTSETYPNKMTATYTRNSVGAVTGVEYTKTAHCASTCPERWFGDSVAPSIHGEALKEASSLSEEPKESYDAAGRLTEVQEIPAGQGCTTRLYAYDQESNRGSLTTRPPGAEGKCATEGGSAESHSYDSGNRLTDSGVSYETFGNTTKLPAADAGGMEVTSSYYVSNQVASQQQNGVTTSYYMDPAGRVRETRSPGVSVNHYADSGSAPVWVMEPESKWTRNVPGIDGSLTATQTSGGVVTLLLHDVHGDIVGRAALSENETKLLSTYGSTEFGVPSNGTPPKFAWLGAMGIASESPTGVIVQNGKAYVPQTGRPLQTEAFVLPAADNMVNPFEITIAPWAVEDTAAMAQQLTAAEEARRAIEYETDPVEVHYMNKTKAREVAENLANAESLGALAAALSIPVDWIDGALNVVTGLLLGDVFNWFEETAEMMWTCGNNKWDIQGHKPNICKIQYDVIHAGGETFVDFTTKTKVWECFDNSGETCFHEVYSHKKEVECTLGIFCIA
jgi:YD repeat-containing protein